MPPTACGGEGWGHKKTRPRWRTERAGLRPRGARFGSASLGLEQYTPDERGKAVKEYRFKPPGHGGCQVRRHRRGAGFGAVAFWLVLKLACSRRAGSVEVHHPGDIFRDGRGAGGAVDCLRVAPSSALSMTSERRIMPFNGRPASPLGNWSRVWDASSSDFLYSRRSAPLLYGRSREVAGVPLAADTCQMVGIYCLHLVPDFLVRPHNHHKWLSVVVHVG